MAPPPVTSNGSTANERESSAIAEGGMQVIKVDHVTFLSPHPTHQVFANGAVFGEEHINILWIENNVRKKTDIICLIIENVQVGVYNASSIAKEPFTG